MATNCRNKAATRIAVRIKKLRHEMTRQNLDAYIIPGTDPHQSEYVAAHWRIREYFSGFTGSHGTLVLTREQAGLWTDGRYFIQAEEELRGSGIALFRMGEEGVPTYRQWLKKCAAKRIGFDARLLTHSDFIKLKKEVAGEYFFSDIAGALWRNRPAMPDAPCFVHELQYTGKTAAEKLAQLRAKFSPDSHGADAALLLTRLDEIAWLCNIRGGDIPCTPVALAFMLVDRNQARLFIEPRKITPAVRQMLDENGVQILPYDEILNRLQGVTGSKKILHSPSVSVALFNAIPRTTPKEQSKIAAQLKAVKNEVELSHIRQSFLKEGVVFVRLLKWLAESLQEGQEIRESDVVAKIGDLRKEQGAVSDSFDTIAAYGKNAASLHYNGAANSRLQPKGLLLIDTGGQYQGGTTDITRTIALGETTPEQRRDFTLVLKGHIALVRTIFPSGTFGMQLDAIARAPIWAHRLNYKSGTGHGVGYFLGVHEGPHSISPRIDYKNAEKLLPGHIVTNEPGIYKEGSHGIRIENLMLVKKNAPDSETHVSETFLEFEIISFCPIDVSAVDFALLTEEEAEWLYNYNRETIAKLKPLLTAEEAEWLTFSPARPPHRQQSAT